MPPRFLHRECPRDEIHKTLLDSVWMGKTTLAEIEPLFWDPHAGFNRSAWFLTRHLLEHRHYGKQAFVVPPPMQKALKRTSLTGIEVEDIHLPYESVYISLEDCEAQVWGGTRTQFHNVGGLFLTRVHPKSGSQIHVLIWGVENERSRHPGDDALAWMTLDLQEMKEQRLDLERYILTILSDPKRETVDPVIDADAAQEMGYLNKMPHQEDLRQKIITGVQDTLRIAFNAMLYLSSDKAETDTTEMDERAERRADLQTKLGRIKNKKKGRARKLQRELDALPTDTVTWLGRSYRDTFSDETGTRSASAQREHWVRGHWWPRKDTIRMRIAQAQAEEDALTADLTELQGLVRSLPVEECAQHLLPLSRLKKAVEEAQEKRIEVATSLNAKRRWVQPYKKGRKERGSTPDSHTYIIK